MPISRGEGYRRGAGKEEGGLTVCEAFFADELGVELERITGADDNYRFGDFRCASGATLECKRQGIDPARYPQNFVEVAEETGNPRHQHGFADLAELLDIDPERLAATRVKVARAGTVELGTPRYLSVSIRSMIGSALTVYVNPGSPAHIYVYESRLLVDAIRGAITFKGMGRGLGLSNEDTFSVFVPPPPARWSAAAGRPWSWNGDGAEEQAVSRIHDALGL